MNGTRPERIIITAVSTLLAAGILAAPPAAPAAYMETPDGSSFDLAAESTTVELPDSIDAQTLDLGDYGTVIMGEVTRDRILADLPDWDAEFFDYEPDPDLIGRIAGLMQDVDITVLLGTWCSDSRREIPRLWKILEMIGYPADEVALYAVGSSRFTSEMPIPSELLEWSDRIKKRYAVERVATIILYRNGEEIGRIVETPETTLEGDLLGILSK